MTSPPPRMGPFSATMLIAGSMIGSGIFIVPAEMVRTGGTGSFLLVAWLITAILTLLGAHAYGELAGMFPRAGGQYVYLKESYGPMPAFLYGWTVFTIIETGALAAVSMAFGKFLGGFLPWVDEARYLVGPLDVPAFHVLGADVGPWHLGLTTARLAAIGVLVLLGGLNALGTRVGIWIQNLFTVTKLGSLAALILLGLLLAPPHQAQGAWTVQGQDTTLPFLAALLVVQSGSLFSSDAWNTVTFIASEIKRPERTITLALLVGPLVVLGLYLLANVVYLRVLGPAGIATAPGDRVGTAALHALLGPAGDAAMTAAILVSTFGCANGLTLAGARLYQAMAADGVFFRGAARLNGRGVPAWALVFQALWASLLTLTGNFTQMVEFSISAALVFYILTVAGLIILRIRRPKAPRPVKVLAYPLPPILYVLGTSILLGALLGYRPSYTWPGLVLVGLGLPVYLLGFRHARVRCAGADP